MALIADAAMITPLWFRCCCCLRAADTPYEPLLRFLLSLLHTTYAIYYIRHATRRHAAALLCYGAMPLWRRRAALPRAMPPATRVEAYTPILLAFCAKHAERQRLQNMLVDAAPRHARRATSYAMTRH